MKKKFLCVFLGLILGLFAFSCLSNNESYYEIVKNMGYFPNTTPVEVLDIKIPDNFNKVYENYNNMQRQGGYDLSLYKGKKCKRYTYLIPNINARANILVYHSKIIGGDICSITLDGMMIPIEKQFEKD